MEKEETTDVEEGEIIDYNPLPRPLVLSCRTDDSGMKYSDNSEDDNDTNNSDSDIDSDSPCFRPKKAKMKGKVRYVNHSDRKTPVQNKKYNVWCTDIQESELADELINCDVRQNKLDRTRDVESYDYTLAYKLNDDGVDSDRESETGYRKRRYNERGTSFDDTQNGGLPRVSVKQRLGRRRSNNDNPIRGNPRSLMDLKVTENDTMEELATDIANKLCEPKEDLILRVVQILGKEKAIALYEECKEIEAAGGMLILNGSRRRTPGGVFLTLIKRDDDIAQEKQHQIFIDDRKIVESKRKYSAGQVRNKRAKEYFKKTMSCDALPSERDLPALLTRGELTVQQFAEANKDKREETDGETPVTNPPPSPATDGGEPIGDERHETPYEEDFLDLGCDNMDIF